MDPERLSQSPPHELSFGQIRSDLAPQLYCFSNAHTKELRARLLSEPEALDIAECVDELRTRIHEQGIVQSVDAKKSIANKITEGYPDAYSQMVSIETPKQYLKRSCVDTSVRPQLRAARDAAVQTSKADLGSRIAADNTHREMQLEHSDDRLEELVRQKIDQTKQTVLDTVDIIQDIYPAKEARLEDAMDDVYESLPPSINKRRAMRSFNPVAANKGDGTLFNDKSYVTDDTPCRYVIMPATIADLNQIENAFYKLKSDLSRYANLSPERIAEAICEELPATLNERQEARLTQALASIAIEELEVLGQDVRSTYDQVPRRGRQPKDSSTPTTDHGYTGSSSRDSEKVEAAASIEEESPKYIEIETSKLGDVSLNLPWCEQQEYEVKLMKQNGHELLFTTAMPSRAASISKDLRKKTDAESGKAFDRMWQQIRATELTNPNGTHAYIKKVKDTDDTMYGDIIVLGTGNRASNAKRIYYGKTSVARFSPLLELAKQEGLSGDTNILFLLAETDKQNQIDVYKAFGLTQAQARAQNVGSI